ncbi:hypothetical protein CBR_g34743 [Chara braunii]|uniref:Uncharacterized protein n=1 Tax=Chara braunii TaxID=69332 RepID=A0A388JZ15_CHABU|nr:hypothetical protein CBR_g34743 [Chara braunii]|eukprot:GBG63044.1 hypothetical protein CBR_g34743 [Chara braunii]
MVAGVGAELLVEATLFCRAASCATEVAKALVLVCACAKPSITGQSVVAASAVCRCGAGMVLLMAFIVVPLLEPCVTWAVVFVTGLRLADVVLRKGVLVAAGVCLSWCNGITCAVVTAGVAVVGVTVGVVSEGCWDDLLCEVTVFVTKTSGDVPNDVPRGGVDVLAEMVGLLTSDLLQEHAEQQIGFVEWEAVLEAPLSGRSNMRGVLSIGDGYEW